MPKITFTSADGGIRITELEDEMLDRTAVDRTDTSRLSCQISVSDELGDLAVTTPEARV